MPHQVEKASDLPIINLSDNDVLPGTEKWDLSCKYVCHALEEYGCFMATFDKVSFQLSNDIFKFLQELFNLPLETKAKYYSEEPYVGYFGNSPELPLMESMGIGDATPEAICKVSELIWPSEAGNFCDTMNEYSRLLSTLEKMVGMMIFHSYNVGRYFDSHSESTTYLLRLAKYRVPEIGETKIGGSIHTDKSFLSILHQNQVNGLEIQRKNGQWIAIDFLPGSFIVMAGDALRAWSNGRVHSPSHRVVMNGRKARYSVAFFSFNKGIIHIPDELVDEDHPRKFKPFHHFGLLEFYRNSLLNNRTENTVETYCGI